jgi:hypothetical protein
MKDFDFSNALNNADKVKAMKASKEKKPSTSIKPLVFEHHPEDSPLKEELINRINARNLTYADIYAYCTDLKGGDIAEGAKLGYNLISGLRKRHTMIDTTFSLLCDFLDLDIRLIERDKSEESDEENEEDED